MQCTCMSVNAMTACSAASAGSSEQLLLLDRSPRSRADNNGTCCCCRAIHCSVPGRIAATSLKYCQSWGGCLSSNHRSRPLASTMHATACENPIFHGPTDRRLSLPIPSPQPRRGGSRLGFLLGFSESLREVYKRGRTILGIAARDSAVVRFRRRTRLACRKKWSRHWGMLFFTPETCLVRIARGRSASCSWQGMRYGTEYGVCNSKFPSRVPNHLRGAS